MPAPDDMLVRQLLEAIAELPNALLADLETGSHHMNNDAAAAFNKRYKFLMEQLGAVHFHANMLAEQIDDSAAPA